MAKSTVLPDFVMDDDELPTDETLVSFNATDVDRLVADIVANDSSWIKASAPISLGKGVRWQPHALTKNAEKIAHFHFAETLRSHVIARLLAAHKKGMEIHIFLPIEALYDDELLRTVAEVDAHIHVLGTSDWSKGAHHLDALAHHRVPISPEVRTAIATETWKRRRRGSSHEKGRRLEALLAFLFELVSDFRVKERNLRGDTDEIDLVIQVDQWSRRCWQIPGVPFVLVEAKNRSEKTGQPAVSQLIRRLQTKRASTRIGLLVTTSAFTQDAKLEVIKMAEGDLTIVLLEPAVIEEWMSAEDSDEFLEKEVRRAMLR